MEHRIELLTKTIEEQNVTISNYKTKLKDVVLAYKNLNQEKLALEATISALKNVRPSRNQATTKRGDPEKGELQSASDQIPKTASESLPLNPEPVEQTQSEINEGQLSEETAEKSQVDVLVSSLLTITQQKERLEAGCVAERKQFRAELNEKQKQLENLIQKTSEIEEENKELRIKLRNQQQEHDKQQNDCALAIKELHSILNSERIIKEQLHSQIEDLKVELEEKKKATSVHVAILSNNESSLREELRRTKEQLDEALDRLDRPPPKLVELERQIKDAKEVAEELRGTESRKLMEAEMKVSEISKITETRICSLEEKILQLSDMLGNAEKGRLNDQCTIQKLKDRNAQLDQENKTLISLTEKTNGIEEMNPQEVIAKFKDVIPSLIQNGHDLTPLFEEFNCGNDLHKACRLQLEQVQEEFGRYKLRAQSVLKNKSKDPPMESEFNQMKKHLAELKEKVNALRNDVHAKELELHAKEEGHAKIVHCLREKHKAEINQANLDWQQKMSNLESELRKQRERTVNMLAEKEQEISELRFYSSSSSSIGGHKLHVEQPSPKMEAVFSQGPFYHSTPAVPDDSGIGASSAPVDESDERNPDGALKHILSRRNEASLLGKDAGNLLHFAQEKARLELELAVMRKQKNAAEAANREFQYLLLLKEDEHAAEVRALRESLCKVERDVGRESANLEYLKNVVYHYMLCKEASSRQQMFNAISTILHFSPQEKHAIQSRKSWKL